MMGREEMRPAAATGGDVAGVTNEKVCHVALPAQETYEAERVDLEVAAAWRGVCLAVYRVPVSLGDTAGSK